MSKPRVLFSILNWNNPQATRECIKSVLNQNYAQVDIVVSDNASGIYPVHELEQSFTDILFFKHTTNMGYAAAHNIVANYADAHNYDLLWILNNDTVVDKNSLTALVQAWEAQPLAIYGSLILEADYTTIRFGGAYPVIHGTIDFQKPWNPLAGKNYYATERKQTKEETSDVNGASMLIPVALFRQYGYLPEQYFLYGEETHYCYHLREQQIPSFIIPHSTVSHAGSQSFSSRPLQWLAYYYRLRNHLLVQKRFRQLTNSTIGLQESLIKFWLPFFAKAILRRLCYKKITLKHYWQQLAVWHALIGRKGKTIAPEKYLHE